MGYKLGEWRIAVIGVGVSTVIAVALAFIVNDTTLLGFAIGLAGTCIVLQIEALVRFTPKNELDEATGAIPSGKERLAVQASALRIAEHAATAISHKQDLLTRETNALLAEAQRTIREAAQGRIRRPALTVDVLLGQIATTKSTLKATTDDRDSPWWLSERGQQFIAANATAIRQRKVRVDRIFMSDGSSDIERVIALHKGVGVHCYLLRVNELSRDLVVNMTIFDDRVVHRDEHNQDGSTRNQLYSVNKDDIEEAERLFEQLRRMADEVQVGPA